MATATLYFELVYYGDVSGASNALGSTAGTWTTDTLNTDVSWGGHWKLFDAPAGAVASGTQTLSVRLRKGSNSGNPAYRISLEANNSEVGFATGTVTSTTGQTVTLDVDGSLLPTPASLVVGVEITGASGGAGVDNTAQIDYGSLAYTYTTVRTTPDVFTGIVTIPDGSPTLTPYKLPSTGSFVFAADISDDRQQIGIVHLGDTVTRSTNGGTSWSTTTVSGASQWMGIAYGNGYWVISGSTYPGPAVYRYSTDLVNWTTFDPYNGTGSGGSGYFRVKYGDGWWYVVSDTGSAWTHGNPDGSWTASHTQFGGADHEGTYILEYENGVWLVGAYYTAPIWYRKGPPNGPFSITHHDISMDACVYGNGYWVAVTGNYQTAIYTSDITSADWTEVIQAPNFPDNTAGYYNIIFDDVSSKFYINAPTPVPGPPTYEVDSSKTQSATTPNGTWTSETGKWGGQLQFGYAHVSKPGATLLGFNDGYVVSNVPRRAIGLTANSVGFTPLRFTATTRFPTAYTEPPRPYGRQHLSIA